MELVHPAAFFSKKGTLLGRFRSQVSTRRIDPKEIIIRRVHADVQRLSCETVRNLQMRQRERKMCEPRNKGVTRVCLVFAETRQMQTINNYRDI